MMTIEIYVLISLVISSEFAAGLSNSDKNDKSARKSKLESQHGRAPLRFCSAAHPTKIDPRYHVHRRLARSVANYENRGQSTVADNTFGSGLYFNGSEKGLRLTAGNQVERESPLLPRLEFTLEIWIKPEGGQTNPAVIVDVSDWCGEDQKGSAWQIGIETKDRLGEKNAHIYFSLQTEMSQRRTQLWANKPYVADQWVHIAASYDGVKAVLYLNSGRVATSHQQSGPIFSELRSSCKMLFLAGENRFNMKNTNSLFSTNRSSRKFRNKGFRGGMDEFRLWKTALSHANLKRLIFAPNPEQHLKNSNLLEDLEVYDSFANLNSWSLLGSPGPKIIPSDITEITNELELKPPACGQTVCDDPKIIESYARNWELRQTKTVRYRVVNIIQSDGRNSSVTNEQIRSQHQALQGAFRKIGNRQCNLECRHPITGNDGGDCDETIFPCHPTLLNNGVCDAVCNRPEHNWDNGQCCNASDPEVHNSCIDPSSPLRAYIGIDEYKKVLNFSNEKALTVKFAEWSNSELIGLSTFPWENEVYSIYGDLAGDTKPTPKNIQCKNPSEGSKHFLSADGLNQCPQDKHYNDTPFDNYMSYADEECSNHFTAHQVARMHCYLDLKYRGWIVDEKNEKENRNLPNIIPLPPKIARLTSHHSENSLTLVVQFTKDLITMPGLKLLPLFLLYFTHSLKLAESQRTVSFTQSKELISELEAAFCSDKENFFPCNEPLGRICLNRQCVSACRGKNVPPCTCTEEHNCTVCCKQNSQAQCKSGNEFGVVDRNSMVWFRQSTEERCYRQVDNGYGPVCPLTDDGKICDIKLNPSTAVEKPQICMKGSCGNPKCNLLNKENFMDCGCRDAHSDYPFCCRFQTNVTCLPYQWWMRQYATNYLNSIGSSTALQLWNPCSISNAEGTLCGPRHICRNFKCEHVCGNSGIGECICSPYSSQECHVCCRRDENQCVSVNINPNEPLILQKLGTPCNFTYGTCGLNGQCETLAKHPLDSVCKDQNNEGQQCAHMSVCRSGSCIHLCGGTDKECQCEPGTPSECHICCLQNQNSQCVSIYDGTRSYLLQPIGAPCNFTYGICDRYGVCNRLRTHPSEAFCQNFDNNGRVCGLQQICRHSQCKHICGSADKLCVCSAHSRYECHMCCLNAESICLSADEVNNRFLRPAGTSCNYTYGTCDTTGKCVSSSNHPNAGICNGTPATNMQACGSQQHCLDGQCQHVCGEEEKMCLCTPGSDDECHICCMKDGECKSIYDNPENKHLLRPVGTPCNLTFGTCTSEGTCQKLENHPSIRQCDYYENEGHQCGPHMICKDFQCQHLCKTPHRECHCPAEGKEECHICCLTSNSFCQSVFDEKNTFKLHNVGTACNYTKGTCNKDGVCEPVANFCAKAENDLKACAGPKFHCKDGSCQHVCGTEDRECICEPGTNKECHVCCMVAGNCTSMRSNETEVSEGLIRPYGTPCNFTRGICIENGLCDNLLDHPLYDLLRSHGICIFTCFCSSIFAVVVEIYMITIHMS